LRRRFSAFSGERQAVKWATAGLEGVQFPSM
jgi:hypothetical protein